MHQTSLWLQALDSAEDLQQHGTRLRRHWAEISADGAIDLAEYRAHERLHDEHAARQAHHTGLVCRFRAYVTAAIHLLNTGRVSRDLAREYPELRP